MWLKFTEVTNWRFPVRVYLPLLTLFEHILNISVFLNTVGEVMKLT